MIIWPSHYKPRVAVIVGTRPNFVKAAPFLREARKYPRFDIKVIHTGQHFDQNMSKVFFEELDIPEPHISLTTKGEKHTEKIALMFDGLKAVFKHHKFDAVVVFGDVNSTLAGALAALKNRCRLVHIEAGLRSHDRRMPEEINRVIVDHISDLHFVSEQSGVDNLKAEGVKDKKIHLVGNIMIESLESFKDKIAASNILQKLGLTKKGYVLTTIHRQENTDSKELLERIFSLLQGIRSTWPIVMPLHPGTRKKIHEYGLDALLEGIRVIEPAGYFDFLNLMANSTGVITDSGGIQEETSHLGVPCCTLRDNTERPVTITLGSNRLFPLAEARSADMIAHLNRTDFQPKSIPLWDNKVSERIFKVLNKWI